VNGSGPSPEAATSEVDSTAPEFYIGITRSLTDRRLRRVHLCVLAALCSFYNRKTGECFPGRQAIAKRAGYGRTATGGAISDLEAWGYIQVAETWKASGAQASNTYGINYVEDGGYDTESGRSPDAGWLPVPDSATPPVSHAVAPPGHTLRTPAATRTDTPPVTQGEPKQRTEPRSQQTFETDHLTPRSRSLTRRESEDQKDEDPYEGLNPIAWARQQTARAADAHA